MPKGMLVIQIVVSWARSLFEREVEVVDEICVQATQSQLGFRFQRVQFEQLFIGTKDWPSMEFLDAWGDPITSLEDVTEGPDGGIDAIIRITTRTEKGAKIVATRIRNMVITRKY
jgi:hypothetical protein